MFVIGTVDVKTGAFKAAFTRIPNQRRTIGDGGFWLTVLGAAGLAIVRKPLGMFLNVVGSAAFGFDSIRMVGLAAVLVTLPLLLLYTGLGRIWQKHLLAKAAA